MSTETPAPQESSGTDPYTEHIEPAAQGGERYVRCARCGRELLVALGGRDNLAHADGCPHA